jgi:hypothetical protein
LNFEKSESISKTLNTLAGDGTWEYLYGLKMLVDPTGIVVRGPDLFIGRKFEDLKNLNYNDVFTVQRSVMRATGATNKSVDPDDTLDEIRKAGLEETRDWLEKTLKIRKAEKENRYVGDPLYRVSVE